MCFSAEADLITGTAVAVVGVDALRHVRRPRELALAGLPMLLATHQLTEAFVWSDLEAHTPPAGTGPTISLYAIVAFVVLPALVPLAVQAVEPVAGRRRLMAPFAVLGVLVAATYAGAIAQQPVEAAIEGRHIAYDVGLAHGGVIAALYIVAVCAPLFASSYDRIVMFGVANAIAVVALVILSQEGLTSLWCAWAAVASTFIAAHLRMVNRTGPRLFSRSSRDAAEGDQRPIGRGACT